MAVSLLDLTINWALINVLFMKLSYLKQTYLLRNCFLRLVLLLIGSGTNVNGEGDVGYKPLLFTKERVEEMRTKTESVAELKRACDKVLGVKASPVKKLEPPMHYSSTGVVHDPSEAMLGNDSKMALNAAVCYALTQDARYAVHAQQIIDAWSSTLEEVKGEQGYSGCNFRMPLMIIAASLVHDVNHWNDSGFKLFLDKIVRKTTHDARKNNHGTWGVCLDACIGFYLDDKALIEKAKNRWNELICSQVDKDGILFLELPRSNTNNYEGGPDKGVNGIHYTHYTLTPATVTAEIFLSQGGDLYSMKGGEFLHRAFVKAASLTLKPETSPYYASNHGVLNGIYADAGYFAVLNKRYPCADATTLLNEKKLKDGGFFLLFDK